MLQYLELGNLGWDLLKEDGTSTKWHISLLFNSPVPLNIYIYPRNSVKSHSATSKTLSDICPDVPRRLCGG